MLWRGCVERLLQAKLLETDPRVLWVDRKASARRGYDQSAMTSDPKKPLVRRPLSRKHCPLQAMPANVAGRRAENLIVSAFWLTATDRRAHRLHLAILSTVAPALDGLDATFFQAVVRQLLSVRKRRGAATA